MIIGITGKEFAGKDTLAMWIRVCSHARYHRIAMADVLKDVCAKAFGIPRDIFDDPIKKETPFAQPLYLEESLSGLAEVLGINLDYTRTSYAACSPRELMQYVGDIARGVKLTYWIDRLDNTIKQQYKDQICIVPDIRYDKEARWLVEEHNGIIVEVRRPFMPRKEDMHSSEAGLKEIKPDFRFQFLENDFDSIKIAAEVVSRLALYRFYRET